MLNLQHGAIYLILWHVPRRDIIGTENSLEPCANIRLQIVLLVVHIEVLLVSRGPEVPDIRCWVTTCNSVSYIDPEGGQEVALLNRVL